MAREIEEEVAPPRKNVVDPNSIPFGGGKLGYNSNMIMDTRKKVVVDPNTIPFGGAKNVGRYEPYDGYDFFDRPGRRAVDGNARPFGGGGGGGGGVMMGGGPSIQVMENPKRRPVDGNSRPFGGGKMNQEFNDFVVPKKSAIDGNSRPFGGGKMANQNHYNRDDQDINFHSKASPQKHEMLSRQEKSYRRTSQQNMRKSNNEFLEGQEQINKNSNPFRSKPDIQRLSTKKKQEGTVSQNKMIKSTNKPFNKVNQIVEYEEEQNQVFKASPALANKKISQKYEEEIETSAQSYSPTKQPPKPNKSIAKKSSKGQSAFASSFKNQEEEKKIVKSTNMKMNMPPAAFQSNANLIPCRVCGRNFAEESLAKHEGVCQKVFKSKRKKFDSSKHRIVDSEQRVLSSYSKKSAYSGAKGPSSGMKGSMPKWKLESEKFRQAMASMKGGKSGSYKGSSTTESYSNVDYAEANGYIRCTTCGRAFNPQAAEKHIPSCASKAKLESMRMSGGKKSNFGKKY